MLKPLLLLQATIFLSERARAEDELVTGDDATSEKSLDDDSSEWYMVLVFSLVFGLFITLFGAIVAYFSFLEDRLMQRYLQEGEVFKAEVLSLEFARRGGGDVTICPHEQANRDILYNVFVGYNYNSEDNYKCRFRKQLKARESDLLRAPKPGCARMLSSMSNKTDQGDALDKADEAEYFFVPAVFSGEDNPCGNDPGAVPKGSTKPDVDISKMIPNQILLAIYILPKHARSAIPCGQVKRASSLRYRLSTVALIAFVLLLAVFCTALATTAVRDLQDEHKQKIGWYAIGTFLVLFVLEIPLISCFLHQFFVDALRTDYLEAGEFVEPDDASSSSMSSVSTSYSYF